MKKLIIALLMTLACNNAFKMYAGGETLESQKPTIEENIQKDQDQVQSTSKKDILKGFAGLGLAGLLAYSSYEFALTDIINKDSLIHKIDNLILKYVFQKTLDLNYTPDGRPNNATHQYIIRYTLPTLTAIASFASAQYGIKKLLPAAGKVLTSAGNKFSSAYSALSSWMKSKATRKSIQ